jgi:hypothetical protein
MSTFVKLPLALLAALAMLLLWSGTASADPLDEVTGTVTDVVEGLAPAPSDDAAPGDAGSPDPADAPTPQPSDVVTQQGALEGPVCAEDPLSDLPLCETDGEDEGDGDEGDGGDGGDEVTAPVCESVFSQLPTTVPGLDQLATLTCDQLPTVLCPLLPKIPQLEAVTGLVCTATDPTTTPTPAPTTPPTVLPAGSAPYYANCEEARAAGAAPITAGQPGYRPELDRDSDGVACEDGNSPAAPDGTNTALTSTGQLAYTGVTPLPLVAGGAALLALGSGFLLAGRRRA